MSKVHPFSDAKSPPKPDWIRVPAPTSRGYSRTAELMRGLSLNTVCEEAACPNMGECWSRKHATVMILGSVCTRACAFCNVKTGRPDALDPDEPTHVAELASALGLAHMVITSVDRDDMADGGAAQFAACIARLREQFPKTTIEVLTPDFLHKDGALETVVAAGPDVFNHNLETVPRLYPTMRPGARYFHSLRLLDRAKEMAPDLYTKSGIMVGLSETREEVIQVMDDLLSARVDFLTIGQYLRPTPRHIAVSEYVEPSRFEDYATLARAKGFAYVSSTPLTRSSFHAGEDFARLRDSRNNTRNNARHNKGE